MANFPTSLDDGTSLPNPSAVNKTNSPSHSALHSTENDAIKALEAKLGTGASTPTNNTFLIGNGTGTSAYSSLTSAQMAARVSDETGSGSLVFANTPTLATPKVDTINENTSANGVTIDGLNIKDSLINTANSIDSLAYIDGSIDPEHLIAGTGTTWAWQSWTPTPTNITVGNGTLACKYAQIGKTVVARFKLTLGSTSSVAGSDTLYTLPVTAASGYATSQFFASVGNGMAFDTSASSYFPLTTQIYSTTQAAINSILASGTYNQLSAVSTSVPIPWATGDVLWSVAMYEAA